MGKLQSYLKVRQIPLEIFEELLFGGSIFLSGDIVFKVIVEPALEGLLLKDVEDMLSKLFFIHDVIILLSFMGKINN
jgi:hypothetical protein